MYLPLFVSFFHSTFLPHIGDKWMGLIGAYANTIFPIAPGMRLLFSSRGSRPKRLLVPLSTTAKCGLWCIRLFPIILLLLLGIPESFFFEILTAYKVLSGMRFMEVPISAKALLMGI